MKTGSEEVRLRGSIITGRKCGDGYMWVKSPQFDQTIKAPGEKWPQFVGSRMPELKLQNVKQSWLPAPLGQENYAYDDIQIEIMVSRPRQMGPFHPSTTLGTLFDGKGKQVLQRNQELHQESKKGVARVFWQFGSQDLKGYVGPFTFTTWVYIDRDRWPLRVSIPLNILKPPKPIR